MSLRDLIVVGAFVALLALALVVAGRLGAMLNLSAELRRKLVHVGLGLSVLALPFLFDGVAPVLLLCMLSVALLLFARRNARFGAALHGVGRKSLGEIYFAVSVAVLFILQDMGGKTGAVAAAVGADPSVFYIVPIAVMTLADTAAALAGTEYGKRVFPVEKGTKSLEGAITFFTLTWLIAIILLLLLTDIPRDAVIALSGFVALVGASVEAESWAGLDNLFVPIGLHIILVAMAAAGLLPVIGYAVLYAAAVVAAFWLAQAKDVAQQPLRAAILLLTVFLMTFGPLNATMLAVVIVVGILANHLAEPAEEHADLRAVFALIAIGIFWMVLGNMVGRNLILAFTVAIVVYGIATTTLSFRHRPTVPYLAAPAFGAALAARLLLGDEGAAADSVLLLSGLGILAAVFALCGLLPSLFAERRTLKITLLSLALSAPLALLGSSP